MHACMHARCTEARRSWRSSGRAAWAGLAATAGAAGTRIPSSSAASASRGSTHAAATTGPARGPRPASSTPATRFRFFSQSRCSRSRFGASHAFLAAGLAPSAGGFASCFPRFGRAASSGSSLPGCSTAASRRRFPAATFFSVVGKAVAARRAPLRSEIADPGLEALFGPFWTDADRSAAGMARSAARYGVDGDSSPSLFAFWRKRVLGAVALPAGDCEGLAFAVRFLTAWELLPAGGTFFLLVAGGLCAGLAWAPRRGISRSSPTGQGK